MSSIGLVLGERGAVRDMPHHDVTPAPCEEELSYTHECGQVDHDKGETLVRSTRKETRLCVIIWKEYNQC